MRSGLLQRLRRGLLLALLGASLPANAAGENVPASARQGDSGEASHSLALDGAERARYLSELKRLYPGKSAQRALLEHCNRLLESYAPCTQGRAAREAVPLFQLELLGDALKVRGELRHADGRLSLSERTLPLAGLPRQLGYLYPEQGALCHVLDPRDATPLLTLSRDLTGVAELARALGLLIGELQQAA